MDKKSKITIIISIIGLALVLITVTYAYFAANITGIESASTISLNAGTMSIVYSEGDGAITANNMFPREEAWVTKTFTLTGNNTTNQQMKYELKLNVTSNTFPDDYLTYDLTLVSSTSGTPIASKTNQSINGTGSIKIGTGIFTNADGDTHDYELKIYFKDNGLDQSDALGAVFNAKIVASEYLEPTPAGWRTAPSGSLLAGIKNNQTNIARTYTVPGVEKSTADEGLRETEDDYGTTFYYRGAVENNYLVFAGMCWRIVRVDGLGNIKITLYNYNPTNADDPCATSLDGNTMAFARIVANDANSYTSAFNSNYNKNTYIGYMYSNNPDSNDYATAHANNNDSTILTNLKSWYDRVFTSAQKNLLADVIWCNDKRVVSDTTYDPGGYRNILGTGLGANKTYYQTTQRLYPYNSTTTSYGTIGAMPTLKCGNSKTDNLISKFTASTQTDGGYGNGVLNGYKIGLLTADEIVFAGAIAIEGSGSYYLSKNAYHASKGFWTLSPSGLPANMASVWSVFGGGLPGDFPVSSIHCVRPAISLKSDVTISGGNGTQASPFVIAS